VTLPVVHIKLPTSSRLPCARPPELTILKVRRLFVVIVMPCGMAKARDARVKREFGDRLRAVRKQKGLSQEALALACELDRTYIGGVERGERNISLLNIHKIARALDISARELMG
jgi:DNA-binding XRE family transcriptional regulator